MQVLTPWILKNMVIQKERENEVLLEANTEYDTTKIEDAVRRAGICKLWLLMWKLDNEMSYSPLSPTKASTAQMSISG